MDQRSLEAAAKSGNIDLLYELIHEDPHVLDKIDNVPFIATPLHVAALSGTTEFAMEMMHLKPSFARKLNADGLTPLHLAVDHGHFWLALELVKVDPSLVRLKGRQGMTPLLLAVSKKNIDLISEFFLVCPKSIVDANVNGENALHIALKNNEPREGLIVLKVLMGWILRLCQKDAERTETRVINCRDKDGNTPLHLAAYENNHKAMRLMLKSSNVNVNIENKNGLTVLDVAVLLRREGNRWGSWCGVERVLKWHGGKRSASLVKIKTASDILSSKLTRWESKRTRSIRYYSWMSEERRNALLVVATLIITATYQTVLQPPGGVSDNGATSNVATSNGTTSGEKAGSVVMDDGDFLWLWIWNSVGFTFATLLTLSLLSLGQQSGFWYIPLFIPLLLAYNAAGQVISPNKTMLDKGNLVCSIILVIWVFVVWFWDRLQSKRAKARGPKSGLVWEGFTTWDQARGVTPSKKSVISNRHAVGKQGIKINEKTRFVSRIVSSMFNTVSKKKIAVLGFAFKKDTGDTRDTPAIDVCKGLLGDKARISIYDPQVNEKQIHRDLTMNKFDWDHPLHLQPLSPTTVKQVSVAWHAYAATKDAHGICILTEWDEFKKLDYERIFENMQKSAFVFDGRNVVDAEKLRKIGFIVYSIGKPLDQWLKDMPALA
ncbi:Ankyrin repeat family protein [Hirschfeldia incana]|nr:Ankyrin repeat family protein [Hirschfeldia incana]